MVDPGTRSTMALSIYQILYINLYNTKYTFILVKELNIFN